MQQDKEIDAFFDVDSLVQAAVQQCKPASLRSPMHIWAGVLTKNTLDRCQDSPFLNQWQIWALELTPSPGTSVP